MWFALVCMNLISPVWPFWNCLRFQSRTWYHEYSKQVHVSAITNIRNDKSKQKIKQKCSQNREIPIFASLTQGFNKSDIKKIYIQATIVSFAVLSIFYFFGTSILDLMGISMSSFKIIGGFFLIAIAFQMVLEHNIEMPIARNYNTLGVVALALATLFGMLLNQAAGAASQEWTPSRSAPSAPRSCACACVLLCA